MRERPIIIAESDVRRLRNLLAVSDASVRDQEHLQQLHAELERALVIGTDDVPMDVVTMNSRVCVYDLANDQRREYTLAYPSDADITANRISVLAPLGTALLGFREDDVVEWLMPGGLRRLRIEAVFQRRSKVAKMPSQWGAIRRGAA